MIVVLGVLNLAFCVLIAICGLWLLVDASLPRSRRALIGVVTCGAVVNVVALSEALGSIGFLAHAFVWPSEAVVNFGTALLMLRECRPRKMSMA
jgi:hypothetical protein